MPGCGCELVEINDRSLESGTHGQFANIVRHIKAAAKAEAEREAKEAEAAKAKAEAEAKAKAEAEVVISLESHLHARTSVKPHSCVHADTNSHLHTRTNSIVNRTLILSKFAHAH